MANRPALGRGRESHGYQIALNRRRPLDPALAFVVGGGDDPPRTDRYQCLPRPGDRLQRTLFDMADHGRRVVERIDKTCLHGKRE
ncbi:hypothetical protein D3C84_1066090 [compost metagenome]